jgi:hypothetical protein
VQPLFNGWVFHLSGSFHPPSPARADIEEVVVAGGGTVVSSRPAVSPRHHTVVICDTAPLSAPEAAAWDDVPVATSRWLLDCASCFQILPITKNQ